MWHYLLGLSPVKKQLVTIVTDSALLTIGLYLSICIRLGDLYPITQTNIFVFLIVIPITAVVFKYFGAYRLVVRYFSFDSIWLLIKAVSVVILLWMASLTLLPEQQLIPRSTAFIFWFVGLALVSGARIVMNHYLSESIEAHHPRHNHVVIYGAGEAGRQLCALLQASPEFKPVFFIDDDPALFQSTVYGLQVHSRRSFEVFWNKRNNRLRRLIDFTRQQFKLDKSINIKQFMLAMPSATNSQIDDITQYLSQFELPIQTLPEVTKLPTGEVKIDALKALTIEDLLARQCIEPQVDLMTDAVSNKCVLVTGAGGSIGSELSRQIIAYGATTLILYDNSERALYEIEQSLNSDAFKHYPTRCISLLADINNTAKLSAVLNQYNVDVIFHAAAYKHVPIVESNPFEAVVNNIFGTYSVAQAAFDADIEKCVLVSTDKAVRPTNIMGATKRFAELVFQAYAQYAKENNQNNSGNCIFSMVRFGNVLGSSGSVIPLFKKQIANGGPITLTDAKITRYFMTTSEASQLVIQACALATGGEVFVLDMGAPVKIIDLAKKMIALSGRDDIEIKIIGLRAGEKMYEELLIQNSDNHTVHSKIMVATENKLTFDEIKQYLTQYKRCINNGDIDVLKELLVQSQTGYYQVRAYA